MSPVLLEAAVEVVILYKVDKRNGTGFATVVELLLQERQDKKYDEWQRI